MNAKSKFWYKYDKKIIRIKKEIIRFFRLVKTT